MRYSESSFLEGLNSTDWNRYKLGTSNQSKLKEYKAFSDLVASGINFGTFADLSEVDGTAEQVVVYKALEAGAFKIVEDTTFMVEDSDIGIDVKFRMSELEQHVGKCAVFRVLLARNDGYCITLYEGKVEGTVSPAGKVVEGHPVFGFDNNFIPDGSEHTLYELAVLGLKDNYSARRFAVDNMLNGKRESVHLISDITPWSGKYQK